jgi:hypothetical protein
LEDVSTIAFLPNIVTHRSFSAYEDVKASNLLGYWPFVGTLYDVSPNARGAANIQGPNVALTFEQNNGFVQIRQPGFVNIPAVDIRSINFSVEFTLRLPSLPSSRQILLSNWQSGNWQYIMTLDTDGTLDFQLRRNMPTNGSDPKQGLVNVTTKVPEVGKFFKVVYVYDTLSRRKLSVFIDGLLAASQGVRSELTELSLHTATQPFVQFGNKADGGPVGQLDADLSQLAFYQLMI